MKKLVLAVLMLTLLSACEKNEIASAQEQSNKTLSDSEVEKIADKQSDFSLGKLFSSQKTTDKPLKWIAPNYAGLQLSRATQTDVLEIFGEPKEQFHPFNEYESTKHEWTFYYENINHFDGLISFTFDIQSKILKEVWLRPNTEKPLTIEKAIETYGNEYFIRGTGKSICSSETLTELEYPFTIVYPQKGIFLWIREGSEVDDILYTEKCP